MTIAPNQPADAQDVNAQLALRLLASRNLSDLPNPALARANLNIGAMATQNPAAVAITGGTLNGVAIGGTVPGYGNFATLVMSGTFDAPATGEFWSDDGARVLRMNDRLLVGGAAANDAAKPNVEKDWLSEYINWPVFNATAAITSNFGTIALTVGSQTAQLDPLAADTTQTTIGVAAFALSNNSGTYPDDYFASYGFYGEARVYPGTVSDSFAAELEAINLSGVANGQPTPYRELFVGSTQALRLGSGGGYPVNPLPALSAIGIVPNGSTFNAGIVFDKAALTGADGTNGFGTAVAMGKGHLLAWYCDSAPDGAVTATITSTIASPANAVSLQAQDGGWTFVQPSGAVGFSVETVANAANYLVARPAAAGSAVGLVAAGPDANVRLDLLAKGSSSAYAPSLATNMFSLGSGSAVSSATYRKATMFFDQTLAGAGGPDLRFGGVVRGTLTNSLEGYRAFVIDEDRVNFSDNNDGMLTYFFSEQLRTGWGGGRTLLQANLYVGNPAAPGTGAGVAGPSAFQVAMGSFAYSYTSAGGRVGAYAGNLFGSNVAARSWLGSGYFWQSHIGQEVDAGLHTGTEAAWKVGQKVVQWSTDRNRGFITDYAYGINNQPGANTPGWRVGFALGGFEGEWALRADSRFIAYVPSNSGMIAPVMASGVDLSGISIVRSAFQSPGFYVDGSGNLGASNVGGASLTTSGPIIAATASVLDVEVIEGGMYTGAITITTPGNAVLTVSRYGVPYITNINTAGSMYGVDDLIFMVGGTYDDAEFTAEISGNTMTVSAIASGTIRVGMTVSGGTTAAYTQITALGTGTGGIGTYTVDISQIVASGTKTAAAVARGFITDVVSNGNVTGIKMTYAGRYSALPSSPVATTTSGSGSSLTFTPHTTMAAVSVSNPGSGYDAYLPPLPTTTGASGSPRPGLLKINMTSTQTLLSLNPGNRVAIPTTHTPASASDVGDTGTISWDADYIYVATATNTWRRAELLPW